MRAGAAFASVVLVSFALVHGCVLPTTDQADGSSCSKDDECRSSRCQQGFCAGSSCKLSDASSCAAGWKCVHSDPDFISDFFGSDGSDTCRPTCGGGCPGNTHCAKDSPSEALCTFGKAPLELTIQTTAALVGEPVRLTVVAAPPAGRIVECEWEVRDGQPRQTTPGPELTRIFEEGRTYAVTASCKDDGGRRGTAKGDVVVGCTPSGSACFPTRCCADKTMRCVPALTGDGNVCRVPTAPTLTITGPATIPIYADAEYVATVSGGDGAVRGVTWSFTDSSFTDSGPSVTHSFSKAGVKKVTARVATTTDAYAEKEHSVTVCQVESGRCDKGEPCCDALTCQGTATFKTCKP